MKKHHSKRLLLEDRVAWLLLLLPFFFCDLVITLLISLDTLLFPGVFMSNADTSHSSYSLRIESLLFAFYAVENASLMCTNDLRCYLIERLP